MHDGDHDCWYFIGYRPTPLSYGEPTLLYQEGRPEIWSGIMYTSSADNLHDKISHKMDATLEKGCSSTTLILCSPQYLVETLEFRLSVLCGIEQGVIQMVAIVEAHL